MATTQRTKTTAKIGLPKLPKELTGVAVLAMSDILDGLDTIEHWIDLENGSAVKLKGVLGYQEQLPYLRAQKLRRTDNAAWHAANVEFSKFAVCDEHRAHFETWLENNAVPVAYMAAMATAFYERTCGIPLPEPSEDEKSET